MYLDLAAFIDNLFIFSHSFTFDSSLLIELHRSMLTFRSANAFKVLDKVVSSAYMIRLHILVALGKSLMYRTNNNGPKIDPCGTPDFIGNVFDLISSICV